MPRQRLDRSDPHLWHLDVHHGLAAAEAVSELCAAWDLMLAAGGTMALQVVHGYGKSGKGGEIYFAVHQLLAANRRRVAQSHPKDPRGQPNPGATVLRVGRAEALQAPAVLQRLGRGEDGQVGDAGDGSTA